MALQMKALVETSESKSPETERQQKQKNAAKNSSRQNENDWERDGKTHWNAFKWTCTNVNCVRFYFSRTDFSTVSFIFLVISKLMAAFKLPTKKIDSIAYIKCSFFIGNNNEISSQERKKWKRKVTIFKLLKFIELIKANEKRKMINGQTVEITSIKMHSTDQ